MAPAAPVTVASIIDEAPISGLQRTVFALCILISLLDGFDTQAIAFVAPGIARDWSISQWQFGFLFSATLLGSAIGSIACGALADRFGRKRLVIASTAVFGIFSAACALATGYGELLAFRLLGGIGMGGVIPNMLALTAEFAPQRRRTILVTLTLWGFPLGAVLGGLVSGPLIVRFGWEAVFWLGAAAPLLLVPVLAYALPESLRFLALDGRRRDQVVKLLRAIDPERAEQVTLEAAPTATARAKLPIAALFGSGLRATTLLLSAMMFSSLFLSYLLINWVPTMLVQAGFPVTRAILGTVGLNLGGIIGSALLAQALDRGVNAPRLLSAGYVGGAIAIALAGSASGSVALVLLMLCGVFHIGSQLTASAFITNSYPVALRATGIGFTQAVGRIGSLVGPVAGGALLSMGLESNEMFHLAVIPAGLCAGLLLWLAWMAPRAPAQSAGIGRPA